MKKRIVKKYLKNLKNSKGLPYYSWVKWDKRSNTFLCDCRGQRYRLVFYGKLNSFKNNYSNKTVFEKTPNQTLPNTLCDMETFSTKYLHKSFEPLK